MWASKMSKRSTVLPSVVGLYSALVARSQTPKKIQTIFALEIIHCTYIFCECEIMVTQTFLERLIGFGRGNVEGRRLDGWTVQLIRTGWLAIEGRLVVQALGHHGVNWGRRKNETK